MIFAVVMVYGDDWGIGYGGDQPVRLSDDLKRFRRLTKGKSVVYGRRTLETFPGGRPLPGRRNLLLTGSDTAREGIELIHTPEQLLERTEGEDVAVIGGAGVYESLLPYCSRVYVTRLLTPRDIPADRFFPVLDEDRSWRLEAMHEPIREGEYEYVYADYVRVEPEAR